MHPEHNILTPEQINDLIAEKIMGWHRVDFWDGKRTEEGDEDLHDWEWRNENEEIQAHVYDDYDGQVGFSPYRFLDDCYLVEENIRKFGGRNWYRYIRFLLDSTDAKTFDKGNTLQEDIYAHLIHATPAQKCEAFLLTYDLIGK